jgi:hypothetical protein
MTALLGRYGSVRVARDRRIHFTPGLAFKGFIEAAALYKNVLLDKPRLKRITPTGQGSRIRGVALTAPIEPTHARPNGNRAREGV